MFNYSKKLRSHAVTTLNSLITVGHGNFLEPTLRPGSHGVPSPTHVTKYLLVSLKKPLKIWLIIIKFRS